MIIKNPILRFVLLPLALFSWLLQAVIFGVMGCAGFVIGITALVMTMLFGDIDMDKRGLFAITIGWLVYYPWLWWYRYFKYGHIGVLSEFKDNSI